MGGMRIAAMAAVLVLSGCITLLPAPETVQLAPVPGVALPFKARVMVFAGETDLSRKLMIQLTRYQSEESKVRDGLEQAKAARILLSKGFERVEVNDASIRPHLVVKLIGKATWIRQDGALKIACGLDAWTSDGVPLGTFPGRSEAEHVDYREETLAAYAQCLKKPVEDLLASPGVARLAGQGFRDPLPPAYEAWMRGLGNIPTFR